MKTKIEYRGYEITENGPEAREYRYGFAHKDYDGPEDRRTGFGKTIQDCKQQIDERLDVEEQHIEPKTYCERHHWPLTVSCRKCWEEKLGEVRAEVEAQIQGCAVTVITPPDVKDERRLREEGLRRILMSMESTR